MVKRIFKAQITVFTRLKINHINVLFECSHQREACEVSLVATALLCSYLNSRIIFQRLLMYK